MKPFLKKGELTGKKGLHKIGNEREKVSKEIIYEEMEETA